MISPQQWAALVFFAVLAGIAVGVAVSLVVRGPFRPVQNVLWRLAFLLVRLWWRAELPRQLPLPEDRGAVLICNHRSSVDPFFIQVLSRRVIHWMVAREFCEHFLFRGFLTACEVIPVNRGGVDTRATKLSIRKVQAGGVIGMFPEGRINMSDQFLLPGRPGAVLIALRAGAPILPCYIEGSPYDRYPWSPLFLPARVRVTFGEPIDLRELGADEHSAGDPQAVRRLMLHCLRAIAKLAGEEEFEPQIAGRRWKPTPEELEREMEARRRKPS